MRNIKKLVIILLALAVTAGCFGCDWRDVYFGQKVNGDFVTQVQKDGSLTIAEFSEEGKKKSTLVIPKQIGNKKITAIINRKYFSGASLDSENLEKLIIEPNVEVYVNINCRKLNKIIFNNLGEDSFFQGFTGYFGEGYKYYLNSYVYFSSDLWSSDIKSANVSFLYNYDGSVNRGYCAIDDVDYGSLLTYIPSEPKRSGYNFNGWYKEKECINKWSFSTDRTPEIKYNEKKEVEYQETKLYAGWTKN